MAETLTSSGNSLLSTEAKGTNVLDKFQTFNCLFTLAALDKNQQQSFSIDRGNVKNIICRSQGKGSGGAGTEFGKLDYFIDDVDIVTIPALTKKTGNTFATKISFKVFEPYSMGLFMLTMQQAAKSAGYGQSFKEAPYLLMIEFIGWENGKPGNSEPGTELTRYIPIKIIEIKFKVGTTGSTYDVTAIPYNEHAFREQTVKSVTDIKISGKTVEEILQKGPTSLYNALQDRIQNEKTKSSLKDFDEHLIQFPKEYTQEIGNGNDIAEAKVYTNLDNNGVQLFRNMKDIFDSSKHIYKSPSFKIEEERVWHFVQEISIPDIITEVILRSEFIQKQIQTEGSGQQQTSSFKPDSNGMISWFRIETKVQDRYYSEELGRHKRLYIYRVLPYKVHIHRFLPPGIKPPGYSSLKNTVSRMYDYIYTGKNTEILNLELNFDMAYFTPVPFDATENVGQNNPSQGGITAGGKELKYSFAPGQSGDNTTGELQPSQISAAQRQYFSKVVGGSGTDNEKTSQMRTMQAILTNIGDMVNLSMEIMGDPYYLPSTGMGNLAVAPAGPNITKEGSMNYQDSEVHIQINFRTPVDLDPVSGLYRFEKGIDIWSGLYQVTEVESRFVQNKFTQIVKGYRLRAQLGGVDSQQNQSIFLRERQAKQDQQGGSPGDSYSAGLLNPDTGGLPGRDQSIGGGGGGGGGRGGGGGGGGGFPGRSRPRTSGQGGYADGESDIPEL